MYKLIGTNNVSTGVSSVNVPTFGNREFVLAGTVNSSGHTTLSANGTASAEI